MSENELINAWGQNLPQRCEKTVEIVEMTPNIAAEMCKRQWKLWRCEDQKRSPIPDKIRADAE
jgi:hypothetical protein